MAIEVMTTETAKATLSSSDLLHSDVVPGDEKIFFGYRSGDHWQALVGLECRGDSALLRSLWVEPAARKQGLGGQLLRYCETYCQNRGISTIYLLTETAQHFFSRFGYKTMCRAEAPPSINATRQASSLCSTEAVMMAKCLICM